MGWLAPSLALEAKMTFTKACNSGAVCALSFSYFINV
jgi:hypothetical protein